MNPKKAVMLNILVSLIFAAIIIVSDLFVESTQYARFSETVMYFLIAFWFIPYSLFSKKAAGKQASIKSDSLCIKRGVAGIFNQG